MTPHVALRTKSSSSLVSSLSVGVGDFGNKNLEQRHYRQQRKPAAAVAKKTISSPGKKQQPGQQQANNMKRSRSSGGKRGANDGHSSVVSDSSLGSYLYDHSKKIYHGYTRPPAWARSKKDRKDDSSWSRASCSLDYDGDASSVDTMNTEQNLAAIRAKLKKFIIAAIPHELVNLDRWMQEYAGREEELIDFLFDKADNYYATSSDDSSSSSEWSSLGPSLPPKKPAAAVVTKKSNRKNSPVKKQTQQQQANNLKKPVKKQAQQQVNASPTKKRNPTKATKAVGAKANNKPPRKLAKKWPDTSNSTLSTAGSSASNSSSSGARSRSIRMVGGSVAAARAASVMKYSTRQPQVQKSTTGAADNGQKRVYWGELDYYDEPDEEVTLEFYPEVSNLHDATSSVFSSQASGQSYEKYGGTDYNAPGAYSDEEEGSYTASSQESEKSLTSSENEKRKIEEAATEKGAFVTGDQSEINDADDTLIPDDDDSLEEVEKKPPTSILQLAKFWICILLGVINMLLLCVVIAVVVRKSDGKDETKNLHPAPPSNTMATNPLITDPADANNPMLSSTEPTHACYQTRADLLAAIDQYLEDGVVDPVFGDSIGDWCFEGITDMSRLFSASRNPKAASFDADISRWDVSSVTSMAGMFHGAAAFTGDLSAWIVDNVENMSHMFAGATVFNSDISLWDVGSVQDMSHMFSRTNLFNSDVSFWDVSQVKNFKFMFFAASAFNQDVSNWRLESAETIKSMFKGARFFDRDLCAWGPRLTGRAVTAVSAFSFTRCPAAKTPVDLTSTEPGPFCFDCSRK